MTIKQTVENLIEGFLIGRNDPTIAQNIQNGIGAGREYQKVIIQVLNSFFEDPVIQGYFSPEKIKTLGEWHLDFNVEDDKRQTFLTTLTLKGTPELIDAALDAGANIDYQNGLGVTSLIRGAQLKDTPRENIECLVDRDADLDLATNTGMTAFAAAFGHEDKSLATWLIKRGASPWATEKSDRPSVVDEEGKQRFCAVVILSTKEQVAAALEAGDAIMIVNDAGETLQIGKPDKKYPLPIRNLNEERAAHAIQGRRARSAAAAEAEPPPGPGGGAARR